MYSHYLQIQPRNGFKMRSDYLASYILGQLHHYHHHHEKTLAIGFPDLDEKNNRTGYRIRIFGEPESLERFINQKGISSMMEKLYINLPKPVPGSVTGYVSYLRDRKAEQATPGYIRRRQERAILRAMAGKNSRLKGAEDVQNLRNELEKKQENSTGSSTAAIKMSSSSIGSTFTIDVRSISAAKPTQGSLNSYGLSSSSAMVSLPKFE